MIRLLFVMPLCALASSQATARNDPSEILLALSEDERNAAFTHLLQESNEKCDRVIRTLFDGTAQGLDNWEVLCQDRNSYSLRIPPEVNADIELVSCRELVATSKRLLSSAGARARRRAAGSNETPYARASTLLTEFASHTPRRGPLKPRALNVVGNLVQ
jgi:hypothetical protein